MTRQRKRTHRCAPLVAAVLISAVLAGACGARPDVVAERSDLIGSRDATGPSTSEAQSPPVTSPPASTLEWGDCSDFDIPSDSRLGTSRWQCTTLSAAMDPFADDRSGGGATGEGGGTTAGSEDTLEPVELALTRHPATGERIGSLLINPGGPGGAGLPFAWSIRNVFPPEVLRSFDIVSWDPRGVGLSTPTISCGPSPDPDAFDLMDECAAATGDLVGHLAAPYSAADMEAIRVALGETRLDFLGYSYGSILGASYAEQFPDRVGRFVLDGVTDPLVGSDDGASDGDFPYYADDGESLAAARFAELCDVTDRCPLGDDSAATIADVTDRITDLPTDDFALDPETVSDEDFDDLRRASLEYSGDWELWATALADAAGGDASAIASLVAFRNDSGDGENDDENAGGNDAESDDSVDPFLLANLVIYCADFGPIITTSDYCAGVPLNEHPVTPVVAVDVDVPILVIGTDFDPLTPGKYAPVFAGALDDAVYITWEGVGHTAFPAPSRCIDDAVVEQLVRATPPEDGLSCRFLDGAEGDVQIAEQLFGQGDIESERLLVDAFEFGDGLDATAAQCAARKLNQATDRAISHKVLGVDSDEALDAQRAALDAC